MRFPFTNRGDEVFIAKWGKKEYRFPPMTTTPMLGMIHDATPLELQGIRKKFAKDWAEQQFFNSAKYEAIRLREGVRDSLGMIVPRGQGMSHAGMYTEADLAPYIKMCLEPLPMGEAIVTDVVETPLEETLHRDDDGNLLTEAISKSTSLRKKAKEA